MKEPMISNQQSGGESRDLRLLGLPDGGSLARRAGCLGEAGTGRRGGGRRILDADDVDLFLRPAGVPGAATTSGGGVTAA